MWSKTKNPQEISIKTFQPKRQREDTSNITEAQTALKILKAQNSAGTAQVKVKVSFFAAGSVISPAAPSSVSLQILSLVHNMVA